MRWLVSMPTACQELVSDYNSQTNLTFFESKASLCMSRLTKWMDRTFYGKYENRWDELMLRDRVLAAMKGAERALDIGAGRGYRDELNFKGRCPFIAGIDPGDEVLENETVDEAKVQVAPDYLIPYDDNEFDLVYNNSVIEHIENPRVFFGEIARVLRPGGRLIAKTPNQYHYVPLIAKLTPHSFHEYYNRKRGRSEVDTFPTVYACNSRKAMQREVTAAGLEVEKLELIEGRPEYLRLTAPTYLCGMAYERVVNCSPLLADFRAVIIVQARKNG